MVEFEVLRLPISVNAAGQSLEDVDAIAGKFKPDTSFRRSITTCMVVELVVTKRH